MRRERLAGQRGKAFEDGHRCLAIELLIDDSFSQAVKFRRTELHAAGANLLDNGSHDRVGLFEMADGSAHIFSPQRRQRE